MSNEIVEIAQECSKACCYIQDSCFQGFDWFNGKNVEILRNIVLVIGVPVGIYLASKRSKIAGRQADTSQSQLGVTVDGQKLDRFQKGAAMLSGDKMSEREAGIYVLSKLAQEDPARYFDMVQNVLCSFVRSRSAETRIAQIDIEWENSFAAPECVVAVVELCKINDDRRKKKVVIAGEMNLCESYLPNVEFIRCNFFEMMFTGSDICFSKFIGCNFEQLSFIECNFWSTAFSVEAKSSDNKMRSVRFDGSDLDYATFVSATFDEVNFWGAKVREAFFVNCAFNDTEFQGARLTGVTIQNCTSTNSLVIFSNQLTKSTIINSNSFEIVKALGQHQNGVEVLERA